MSKIKLSSLVHEDSRLTQYFYRLINTIQAAIDDATDDKVKIDSADTTPSYLLSKLQAGANIGFSIINPGANEKIQIQAAGGGGSFPSPYLIWVSADASPVGADGSFGKPFKTIQSAINTIPAGSDPVSMRHVYVILIAPGSYDEDLNIDITRKRIALLGLGPWNLGTFQGTFWAPAPPPFGTEILRNIYVTNTQTNIDSIRATLSIGTIIPEGDCLPSHDSYSTGARISGQIIWSSSSGFIDMELYARAEIWHGIDGTGIVSGTLHMFLDRCRVRDALSGVPTDPVINVPNGRLQWADHSRFFGKVTVNRYSLIRNCLFENGLTVTSASVDYRPGGMFATDFAGTFTGPANSARMDGSTNYYFKLNGALLAGGATKVILDDLVP